MDRLKSSRISLRNFYFFFKVKFQIDFADGHFGSICSARNLQHSIKYYDCISNVTITDNRRCQEFIIEIAERKNDQLVGIN